MVFVAQVHKGILLFVRDELATYWLQLTVKQSMQNSNVATKKQMVVNTEISLTAHQVTKKYLGLH